MNATSLAQSAYSSFSAPVRTSRATEHDVFARVTRRLRQADAKGNFPDYVQALHDNRQLWTLLAVDVADAGNTLPQALRAQIFYLAEFTQAQTTKVLAGTAEVQALIDINTAVMSGLRQQGETQ